jgi:general secretion pathway protein C
VSFVLFLALCASATAWVLPWLRPAPRAVAVAAAPEPVTNVADLRSASTLFGAPKASAPVAANYALKGVMAARKAGESLVLISADGKPTQAVREGAEVVPGVTVKEVHPQYVLLSEAGREKRVELPNKKPEVADKSAPAAAPEQRAAAPVNTADAAETRADRSRRRARAGQ